MDSNTGLSQRRKISATMATTARRFVGALERSCSTASSVNSMKENSRVADTILSFSSAAVRMEGKEKGMARDRMSRVLFGGSTVIEGGV